MTAVGDTSLGGWASMEEAGDEGSSEPFSPLDYDAKMLIARYFLSDYDKFLAGTKERLERMDAMVKETTEEFAKRERVLTGRADRSYPRP